MVAATAQCLLPEAPPADPGHTDAELVLLARGGDRAAQEALFGRHLGSVRALVHRLLPRDPELDDVVQECFVYALGDLRKLEEAAAFGFWLKGIAVNLVRGRLRRRSLLRRLGLYSPHPDPAADLVSSSAPADVAVELRALYAIVDRLGADARTILVLSRIEERSLAEIAELTGLSLSTVKRRLAAAEAELDFELRRRGAKHE